MANQVTANRMTVNQLSVLLDIYRGTFRSSRHMGTVATDLLRLAHLGLVTLGEKPACTKAGEGFVADIKSRANELAALASAASKAGQTASRLAGPPAL